MPICVGTALQVVGDAFRPYSILRDQFPLHRRDDGRNRRHDAEWDEEGSSLPILANGFADSLPGEERNPRLQHRSPTGGGYTGGQAARGYRHPPLLPSHMCLACFWVVPDLYFAYSSGVSLLSLKRASRGYRPPLGESCLVRALSLKMLRTCSPTHQTM